MRSDNTDPQPRSRRDEGNPKREQPELGKGDRAVHWTARDEVEARFVFPELVPAGRRVGVRVDAMAIISNIDDGFLMV